MAIGSGLAGQFGFADQSGSGYDTAVTVDHFIRPRKAAVKRAANRMQGEGIQTGVLLDLDDNFVETQDWATGTLEMDVYGRSMGLLLQSLMGTTATPVQQGATAAWLQTHTLADPLGKFLTIQSGVPLRGGTVTAKTGVGARVTKAEFSCDTGGLLESSWEFDCHSYDDTIGLAAASFPALLNKFHFAQMAVRLGTFGAETAVTGVKSMSVSIERVMDTEGFYANNAGRKVEPVLNDRTAITGSLSVDYLVAADFENRARDKTATSLVIEFIGPVIEAAETERITFILPVAQFELDTPEVDGPDVVRTDWSFMVKFDGTNLPEIQYMSRDTTL